MIDWDAEDAVVAAQLQAAIAAGYGEIARQEIHNLYLTAQVLGKPAGARNALDTYIRFFTTPELPGFKSRSPFAMINRVGNDTYSIGNWIDLPPDTLFWGIDLYAVGENADITTRTIITSPQDKLLAAQVPLTVPPISKLEYVILWICLGILLSALVISPVVLWRVKKLRRDYPISPSLDQSRRLGGLVQQSFVFTANLCFDDNY